MNIQNGHLNGRGKRMDAILPVPIGVNKCGNGDNLEIWSQLRLHFIECPSSSEFREPDKEPDRDKQMAGRGSQTPIGRDIPIDLRERSLQSQTKRNVGPMHRFLIRAASKLEGMNPDVMEQFAEGRGDVIDLLGRQ